MGLSPIRFYGQKPTNLTPWVGFLSLATKVSTNVDIRHVVVERRNALVVQNYVLVEHRNALVVQNYVLVVHYIVLFVLP